MRKIILFSCFCFSFLISSEELQAQFNYAIQAGTNIGSINYKLDGETQRLGGHIGIRLGLVAERQMTEKIVLHTGVIYSQKGSKEKDSGDDWTSKDKLTINYLDVPLLIKYNVGKAYILGGITLGYALSGKYTYKYTEDGETDSGSESMNLGSSDSDAFGRLDGAVTLGLGYPINIKGYDIILNAYYNYGIIDIAAIEEGNVTNSVIGIGATYFFKGKSAGGKSAGKNKRIKEDSNDDDWEYEEEDWR